MPNINDPIIDFNDFNAEPQLLRDIQDGKAIAFYSFAHLLLDTSGKPYTLPTGLYISGAYDTLQQLQSAFPTGNTNLYIVNADKYIYYWNGSAWTKGGTIDATYAFGVELQVPNTATNGTLTQEQFNQLSSNENAYILFNNERYLLMDKGHEADTWGYSHLGADITGAKIKVITINTSNRSWVLTDEEFVKDGTISTQKIQDGAVTTQKLSSDVILQIRKNDFASRFNSDRLNILEAQINADKNTIEYTSDKPLEITCNGANIIDCNAHFKKVEGQTRRYSPNIVELTTSTYKDPAGRYTLDVRGNASEVILKTKTIDEVIRVYFNNRFTRVTEPITIVNCGTEEFYVEAKMKTEGSEDFGIEPNNVLVIDNTKYKEIALYKYLFALDEYQNKTFVFKPMVLKGRYTAETIPPFQPYDNTLVNSKANFVSTGRNLFKYNGIYESSGCSLTYNGTNFVVTSGNIANYWLQVLNGIKIPKGTYYFGCNVINGTGTIYIVNSKGDKELSYRHTATGQIKGTFTINEDEENIKFRITPSTINASATFTDLFITKADTGYEPYIKNISQYDIELGAYDYIENGNLVRQTSEMITLNGSEGWTKPDDSQNIFIMNDFGASDNHRKAIINSTNWSYKPYETWISDSQGFDVQMYDNEQIRIDFNCNHIGIKTLEEWKAYLKANPITLVYQKATPTITPIVVPNGIVSYKNGLTSQEIKGKYLPYKYTAKYVNGGQQ